MTTATKHHKRGGRRLNANGHTSLLTERQRQILRLVSDGLNDKTIATKLFFSEVTIHKEV